MSKELNKKNIKKIEALITIKDSYDDIGQSVWNNIFETMDIPIDIIKTIMNKEYSNSFLLGLLNKIENSEGCNDIERTIINIIDNFIFIKNKTFNFDVIRQRVQNDYKDIEFRIKQYNSNEEIVYNNQKKAAMQIFESILQDIKTVSLVALPQVGKTGVFRYVTYLAMTHMDDSKIYFPEDIFIITGMSDNDWQKQTTEDMFSCIKGNVYHLGKIKEFHKIIENKRNTKILIIIDECQIATTKNLQIDKIIKDLECQADEKNINIKYLVVSATPSVIKYDLDKCGTNHKLVIVEPSEKYVSFQTFINEDRLCEADELSYEFLDNNFLPLLKEIFIKPKYHIIRLSEKKRSIFINWCKKYNYIVVCLDSKHPVQTNLLIKEPIHHTFIIIKGYWRAGKRMKDKHVGIVYEYNPNKDIDITAQGLVARFCGNDKLMNTKVSPRLFCKIDTIKEYINFINKECNFHFANYTSNKIKVTDGEVIKSKETIISNLNTFVNDKNRLIEKKDYIDIPIEINIESIFDKIVNKNNNKYEVLINAENILLQFLSINQDNIEIYNKIINNKMIKAKITVPDPDNKDNYKRHIIDTRSCINRNAVCKTDINDKKYKYKNVWVGFIDINQKSILLILYYGERRNNNI